MSLIQPRIHRTLQLVLFAAALSWAIAANLLARRAARGIVVRLNISDEFQLLYALFLVFLLIVGFAVLQRIAEPGVTLRIAVGLPQRPTSRREWATGVAIGWAVVLASVVPMAIAGDLSIRFWVDARSLWLAGLNLVTAALLAFAAELAFRGFAYHRLRDALGPTWATAAMSAIYGVAVTSSQESTWLATLIAVLLGAVLSTAWLRTHALWLGWGLHFAWIASLGILFGLPVLGVDNLSSLVETRALGRLWLTGGDLGPEGALLTPLLLIVAIGILITVSRDWAWDYTRKELIPAGYPMDVPPPAVHAEMERSATASAPALVQILPTTSQTISHIGKSE